MKETTDRLLKQAQTNSYSVTLAEVFVVSASAEVKERVELYLCSPSGP